MQVELYLFASNFQNNQYLIENFLKNSFIRLQKSNSNKESNFTKNTFFHK